MAFTMETGAGARITVNEPQRKDYPDNLGGAISYYLHLLIYRIFESMGRQLSRWLGGSIGDFLKDSKDEVTSVVSEIYGQLETMPNMPAPIKKLFGRLKQPKGEMEVLIATVVLGTIVPPLVSAVMGAWTTPVTYWMNNILNLKRPEAETLVRLLLRGGIDQKTYEDYLNDQGYAEILRQPLIEINRPRAGLGELMEGLRRGLVDENLVIAELVKRGYPPDDIALFRNLVARLLGEGELITSYHRGLISKEDLYGRLAKLGYKKDDLELIFRISENLPPLSDVIRMSVREAWRDDVATKWGYDEDYPEIVAEYIKKLGYDPDWGLRYWRAHWELPSVSLGMEMVHRGIITVDEFKELLRIADYPLGWRERITQAVFTPFTRVDVRRMYKLGILSFEDMVKAYKDLGYDEWHARKLAEFTQLYEADDPEDKSAQYKQLTLSMLQKAYLKNLISLGEFQQRVKELGYPEGEIDLIVRITDLQRTVEQAPDFFKEYQKDIKSLVERSYAKGMIDYQTAKRYLQDVGITDEEIEYILSVADYVFLEDTRKQQIKIIGTAYTNGAIDRIQAIEALGKLEIAAREQERLLETWDIQIMLGSKRLTEAQYRHAVIVGSINLDDYAEAMKDLGYAQKDIATLQDMLIEGLSGKDVQRLIRIGTITETQYRGIMKRLGYTDAEIDARLS